MRRFIIVSFVCFVCVFTFILLFKYYQYRWRHLWVFENERSPYPVICHEDDTIRVAMIGDSWAEMHSSYKMDGFLQLTICDQIGHPVKMISKGKGGETSKGIYQLLFDEKDINGTKTIIASGIDYCIISAGINDAAHNLGPILFCYHMRLILNFLLNNNIRPVVIEIPDVNLWKVYGKKNLKDLTSDYIRSIMSHCRMYQVKEYRDSLHSMLVNENYIDSVIYIPMNDWNRGDENNDKQLFLDDQIHLNIKGYKLLDSCVAISIAADLKSNRLK